MRFGPVPLTESLGAILAHSVSVAEGRLRKGRLVDAEALVRLEAAGLSEVTVARLGHEDIHEDEAVRGRVTCFAPVTAADIRGMGVGGLLKEIPDRGRPREG